MGGIFSYFWGSNEPDPVTGLTPREKYLVKTSFSIVQKDMVGAGTELFMMLFEKKPEYQNFFPFRDTPLSELRTSPRFKAHAVTVMYSIASLVENLENGEILVSLLGKIGESHAKRRIPEESFHILRKVIVALMEKTLESKINKEGLDAWDKTLQVAFNVIIDNVREDKET